MFSASSYGMLLILDHDYINKFLEYCTLWLEFSGTETECEFTASDGKFIAT